MKAFLLAAGKGTRLKPLTDKLPKCLVPIAGKPLLEIWLLALRNAGVTDVLVNTHHLADQVCEYIAQQPVANINVTLYHEPELLGSAGTVAENQSFVEGEKSFLIIYADNLTNMDLSDFMAFHEQKKAVFSMALFKTPTPSECGIVVCDANDLVQEFQEKPAHPKSDWANAGLYIANTSLFQHIPQKHEVRDFGFDVLPSLIGEMYGYPFEGFYCDTGTPERLTFAREHWLK